jgi:sortase (surface protein transpeptidase)
VAYSNFIASRLRRIKSKPVEDLPQENSENQKDTVYDADGNIITEQLKRAGINTGFISSRPFIDLGVPVKISEEERERLKQQQEDKAQRELEAKKKNNSLANVVPAPKSAVLRNVLIYDKYKIRAPIIYATFEDLFEKREDGTFDFSKPINTDGIDTPVQKKLEQGIVHLAYTPQPGEIGNSYIVGHSSNYSWVNSPYNRVFAPINQQSQVGETFVIYDRYGRELTFRVFEVLKIRDDETEVAYKNFPDKRVVTLQTSILGTRNGRIEATHRWLTRGELVLD